MRPIVLFLETVAEAAMEPLLRAECEIIEPDQRAYDHTRVRVVVTRGKGQVDAPFIDDHPNLGAVVRCGVGVNNIDVDYATERGVEVFNVPGVNAATVAEHTIGLMLMSVRGLYRLAYEVKKGNWNYRTTYAGRELRGLTLGIIGMGNIGRRVADRAAAMEMKVVYTNRSAVDVGYQRLSLEALLAESEVVSLHTPLTAATNGMINAKRFQLMKPGAHLINTARGAVVDAKALEDALDAGTLSGYASDLMTDNVIDRPEVIITPHAASLTELTFREMSEGSVSHVLDYLAGRPIAARYRVNGP